MVCAPMRKEDNGAIMINWITGHHKVSAAVRATAEVLASNHGCLWDDFHAIFTEIGFWSEKTLKLTSENLKLSVIKTYLINVSWHSLPLKNKSFLIKVENKITILPFPALILLHCKTPCGFGKSLTHTFCAALLLERLGSLPGGSTLCTFTGFSQRLLFWQRCWWRCVEAGLNPCAATQLSVV